MTNTMAAAKKHKSFLLLCIALLILNYVSNAQSAAPVQSGQDIDYTVPGAPMPALLFMSYKDTSSLAEATRQKRKKKEAHTGHYTLLSGEVLSNKANLLVMIFSPECEHCNAVATMLENNAAIFKQSKLLLLTSNVLSELIPNFAMQHQLYKYPNTYVGFDSSDFAKKIFLYQSLPQISIYSPERVLIKHFTGEVSFDSLRQYIQ